MSIQIKGNTAMVQFPMNKHISVRKTPTMFHISQILLGIFYSTISFLCDAQFLIWKSLATMKLILSSPFALKMWTSKISPVLIGCHKAGLFMKIRVSRKPIAYGVKTLSLVYQQCLSKLKSGKIYIKCTNTMLSDRKQDK